MNNIRATSLDASSWETRDDFYDALLPALGAPTWHGRTLDALLDSISSDDVNDVHLPYRIRVIGTDSLPPALRAYLRQFADAIADASDIRGSDVSVSFEPPL